MKKSSLTGDELRSVALYAQNNNAQSQAQQEHGRNVREICAMFVAANLFNIENSLLAHARRGLFEYVDLIVLLQQNRAGLSIDSDEKVRPDLVTPAPTALPMFESMLQKNSATYSEYAFVCDMLCSELIRVFGHTTLFTRKIDINYNDEHTSGYQMFSAKISASWQNERQQ